MPLLDIATAQLCYQSNVCRVSSQTVFGTRFRFVHNKEIRLASSWNSFLIPQKDPNFARIKLLRGGLVIRAVATLKKEPTKNTQSNEERNDFAGVRMDIDSGSSTCSVAEQQLPSQEPAELDEREKLRRMRISKANKGNKAWNKGRKHSPETIQRIRERTRLAMQDPKVKMKLAKLGHAQSEETRMKIGVAVRIGWERRREMLMLKESCLYEWQNLIAEASRRGFLGEEELQWDSYNILKIHLDQEWIQCMEERKSVSKHKGGRRAPKSAEQRRKISEAIAAKWADPAYRTRVRSGLAKYHRVPDGVERKPRRKPVSDGQTRKRSSPKKKANDIDNLVKPEPKIQVQRAQVRRKNTPTYKDPLASSKLELLKNIRARRASVDQQKIDAITRAKKLIAEAEKAAEALEVAAKKSPLAQASLIETRKLISEAIQSIESIGVLADGNDEIISSPWTELVSHIEDAQDAETGALDGPGKTINGFHVLVPMGGGIGNLDYGQHALQGLPNGKSSALLSTSDEYDLLGNRQEVYQMISGGISSEKVDDITQHYNSTQALGDHETNENPGDEQALGDHETNENPGDEQKWLPNGLSSESKIKEMQSRSAATTTKKWVCGRLVEVG